MPMTVHAIYPISDGASFDYDYYTATHLPLVERHFGPHGMISITASKGLAGGPDTPPGYFAVATMTFPDQDSMNAALGEAGPVLDDLKNFTSVTPDLLIGSVM
ncbi:EthD family reductase [Maritimibacter sp. 55A14]|uniref:EthD family reductase n=1 Tax=Maritimibacter sp. 55A14 TaxID=2174844 RepID=UPI000D609565|nr:EthD family reductase [Maritimibacter sp. 55A14]PWE33227.1 EthD family reductase [Maritimibacter sp. 55A14]